MFCTVMGLSVKQGKNGAKKYDRTKIKPTPISNELPYSPSLSPSPSRIDYRVTATRLSTRKKNYSNPVSAAD